MARTSLKESGVIGMRTRKQLYLSIERALQPPKDFMKLMRFDVPMKLRTREVDIGSRPNRTKSMRTCTSAVMSFGWRNWAGSE